MLCKLYVSISTTASFLVSLELYIQSNQHTHTYNYVYYLLLMRKHIRRLAAIRRLKQKCINAPIRIESKITKEKKRKEKNKA